MQCIERKQDLTDLAPKDCFISAKTIERVDGQIGQAQKATCKVSRRLDSIRSRTGLVSQSIRATMWRLIDAIEGIGLSVSRRDNVMRLGSSFAALPGFTQMLGLDFEEAGFHGHPALLLKYRNRLATNRLTHPLFDTDRFRRHIEAAYLQMWEIWQRGERPRNFAVEIERFPSSSRKPHSIE
jgi:hypothetical protein